ncbi:MAG: hypothetical protein NVSMB9_07710 [Isosphaeraceae bacterium]
MWVKFTPFYLAGMVSGAGVPLFVIPLVAQNGPLSVSDTTLKALALVGIIMIMIGGFWNGSLQRRQVL